MITFIRERSIRKSKALESIFAGVRIRERIIGFEEGIDAKPVSGQRQLTVPRVDIPCIVLNASVRTGEQNQIADLSAVIINQIVLEKLLRPCR